MIHLFDKKKTICTHHGIFINAQPTTVIVYSASISVYTS